MDSCQALFHRMARRGEAKGDVYVLLGCGMIAGFEDLKLAN